MQQKEVKENTHPIQSARLYDFCWPISNKNAINNRNSYERPKEAYSININVDILERVCIQVH